MEDCIAAGMGVQLPHMRGFLLGLVVALAIGAGVYYFLMMDTTDLSTTEPETVRGADVNLQADPMPENVIMEDGTLD